MAMELFEETFRCTLCGRELPMSKLSPPFWESRIEKPICVDCYRSRPELELVRKIKETLEDALRRIKEERRKGGAK